LATLKGERKAGWLGERRRDLFGNEAGFIPRSAREQRAKIAAAEEQNQLPIAAR